MNQEEVSFKNCVKYYVGQQELQNTSAVVFH